MQPIMRRMLAGWGAPSGILVLNNPNAYGTPGSDNFGISVGVSGDRAIVGARLEDDAGGSDSGKAYIFDVTTGELLFTLNNPNRYGTSASDYFGFSCSISGSRAVVGAFGEDLANDPQSGAAYIFSTITGGLLFSIGNPDYRSYVPGRTTNAYFGWSVAISDTYAVIGAPGAETQRGRAFVYNAATGALLYQLSNTNPGDPEYDQFGFSVAVDGTTALVGAPYTEVSGGKAYAYNVSTGALIRTFDNPNYAGTPVGDQFGNSVAIEGDYAVVGARNETVGSAYYSGVVYVFSVSTGTLLHTILNPGAGVDPVNYEDHFGHSVSIDNGYIVVGAYGELGQGKAYIFSVATGGLLHTINNPDINKYGASPDDFGEAVSISGTNVIAGARGEYEGTAPSSGRAYIFDVGKFIS